MKVRLLLLSLCSALVAIPCRPTDPASPVFVDVTQQAGIHFRHHAGGPEKDYIFEAKGGGTGLFDYDNDGYLDIFFTNGNTLEDMAKGIVHPNALYHANGDGSYTDVTRQAGVEGRGWAMGCATGDYDNDGYVDLLVLGLTENILYHNNHDGTFTDVTAKAGIKAGQWSTSAAFFDYDKDGFLDLYISNYINFDLKNLPRRGSNKYCNYRGIPVMCGPRGLDGAADVLYHNNGDGSFTDVTAAAGVAEKNPYYGLGVAIGDYNNDGWPDIYVANDSCPSYLYVNKKNGTFEEVGLLAGVAVSDDGLEQAGMGVDFGDYDNDGWLDITKTNFSYDYNNLYHNERNGLFVENSRLAGIAEITMPFVCWGTHFIDYDNDGWKDLFVATGHVYPHLIQNPVGGEKYYMRKLLFRNLGNGKFSDVSKKSGPGMLVEKASRGAAFGDLDNDGDIDVVVANMDDVPTILRNDGGNANNWLTVRLKGTKSNRFGLGARVRVTAGGLQQIVEVSASSSIYSANDPRAHFGLNHATEADLQILWPSGKTQEIKGVAANRIVLVDEDKGLISDDKAR
jgi:hypothetical protein